MFVSRRRGTQRHAEASCFFVDTDSDISQKEVDPSGLLLPVRYTASAFLAANLK